VFENMDIAKEFGRSVADLEVVFATHPDAGFCLDVAHVWTNDRSLRLGHDLLDAFAGRLRQLHVSGIEPDGTHRTTTQDDLELYRPLLERCSGVPWILEAVVEQVRT
jgi:sugar phosphate isomerase/epimerase